MLNKNDIKLIRSLRLKKYRQKYNYFIIEGEKLAIEAIKFSQSNIEKIYCVNEFYNKYISISSELQDLSVLISEKELSQISNLKNPNSVLILLKLLDKSSIVDLEKSRLIVYLDDIMDPGNMGTIIRTCEWFGVDSLVTSNNSVDIYNPKVIQSSMGSIFRLPILKHNFNQLLLALDSNKFNYYGTLLEGENSFKTDYQFPMVLVIGNESKGISNDIISKLNKRITIPRLNSETESLNAAVATGIVLADINKNKLTT